MFNKNPFIFLCFTLAILDVYGQDRTIALRQYTSENGLSDSRVTAMLKDSLGFVWIGTKDGLNRFDGREFHIFKNDENDSASLGANRISSLAYDADSILWIGTAASGFSSYDFRTGKFTNYNKNNTELHSNSINNIVYDKQRRKLWVAQNNYGLQLFDTEKRKFVNPGLKIPETTFFDVVLNKESIYVSGIGIRLVNLVAGPDSKSANPNAATINKIFIGSDDKVWCGAWDNGLHEFDKQTHLLNSYIFDGKSEMNFSGDELLSLIEDKNKILWCGTKNSGIHFFDLSLKQFVNKYQFSLGINSRVNCLYRDEFDRIWIGAENGLFLYDPLLSQFEKVRIPLPPNAASCKVFGRTITKGGKEFVISACGLFYKFKGEAEYSFKEFIYENEKQKLVSIYKDLNGRVFIGTNRTIFTLDTNTLNLQTIKSNVINREKSFYNIAASSVNEINQVIHHHDTLIAVSFYGYGISLIDYKKENIFNLYPSDKDRKERYENLNRRFFIDSENNFLVCGASKGVSKISIPDSINFANFNSSDDTIRRINYPLKTWANIKSGHISSLNDVFDMIENKDGTYWLSSQGYGLVKFNPGNDTLPFQSYSGNYKSLHGLIKNNDSTIWIISSGGLLNYKTKSNHYKLYNSRNGINETIGGYFFRTGEKNLNIGFDGGYFSFDPDSVLENTEKPHLQISQLWVMDMTADSLLLRSKLELDYNKNFIKFYVSSNCFSINEQVQYSYFLEGIDDAWRSNGNNPLITYTNLPPGNFTLKIKAQNSDGLESDILTMAVIIIPPFYQTPYFYAIAIALLCLGAYTFYRYRIGQILKLQEVRNKIARDLHDDIGSTLGSINLYSQVAGVKLKGENAGEIKSILDKIENSSREIIDKTSDAVWVVNPSNDLVKDLIMRMEGYSASLLGTAGIHFNIKYDEKITDEKLSMELRKNLFLIYKEAIHNIIKYAAPTKVDIQLKQAGGKFMMRITDNGRGFDRNEARAYNGNGLKNMKTRIEELKGGISIESEIGKGTSIEVTV